MIDPATQGAAVAGGIVAIQLGTILGAPIDSLAIGFAAALFVTMWLETIDSLISDFAVCIRMTPVICKRE